MDYEQRLRRLDTEETTELADLRARVNVVDREIETAMHEVRRSQNAIVRLTLRKAGMKEEEDAIHGKFKYRRDELHQQEKAELRQRQAAIGKEVEIASAEVARRIPKAPRFTPEIKCFLKHPLLVEEHDVGDCYFFLSMSNPDRVKLLVDQHRCFGCFMPTAIVTHELNRCPHRRYCAMCKTPEHHQLLCAPRKIYDDAMLGPKE
jgi:hypothetical protein